MVLDADKRDELIRRAQQLDALDIQLKEDAAAKRACWLERYKNGELRVAGKLEQKKAQIERRLDGEVDLSGVQKKMMNAAKKEPDGRKHLKGEIDEDYFLPPFEYKAISDNVISNAAIDFRRSDAGKHMEDADSEELAKSDINLLYAIYELGVATDKQIDSYLTYKKSRDKDLLLPTTSTISRNAIANRYKQLWKAGYIRVFRCFMSYEENGINAWASYTAGPTAYVLTDRGRTYLQNFYREGALRMRHPALAGLSPQKISVRLMAADMFGYLTSLPGYDGIGYACMDCRMANSRLFLGDDLVYIDASADIKNKNNHIIHVGIFGVLSSYDRQIEPAEFVKAHTEGVVRRAREFIHRFFNQGNSGRIIFICEDVDAIGRIAENLQEADVFANGEGDYYYAVTYRVFSAFLKSSGRPLQAMYQYYFDEEQKKAVPIGIFQKLGEER